MAKIGFIGMGNMGTAIMRGLLKTYKPEELLFTSAHEAKMQKITEETGVAHVSTATDCAEQVKYLVLAVKPQQFDTVIGEIRDPDLPKGYEAGPSDPFVNLRTGGFALHLPY